MGSSQVAVTWTSDFAPSSIKESFDNQAIIESGFTLKCVHDIWTYCQMHRPDKCSQHSSIIQVTLAKWLSVRLWTKWLWFESICSHLNFRFPACFEQGVPWHSGNYRVWIHSEMCTWHDKNLEGKLKYVNEDWVSKLNCRITDIKTTWVNCLGCNGLC